MRKIAVTMSVLMSLAGIAMGSGPAPAPEIDPSSAVGALVMLSGAVLVMRGRKK